MIFWFILWKIQTLVCNVVVNEDCLCLSNVGLMANSDCAICGSEDTDCDGVHSTSYYNYDEIDGEAVTARGKLFYIWVV